MLEGLDMSEQSPAALVARAKKLADWLRKMDDVSGDAALLEDLASALEAALAREGRLREAVEAFVWYDSNPDDEGVTMMTDYAKALELARATLAAREALLRAAYWYVKDRADRADNHACVLAAEIAAALHQGENQ